jgi:hypothetical protein
VENETKAANATKIDATSTEIAKTDRSPATLKVVRRVVIKAAAVRDRLSQVNLAGLEAPIAEVATKSHQETPNTTVTTNITPRTPVDVVAEMRGSVVEIETETETVTVIATGIGTETEQAADAPGRTSSPTVWPPILTSRTGRRSSQLRKAAA